MIKLKNQKGDKCRDFKWKMVYPVSDVHIIRKVKTRKLTKESPGASIVAPGDLSIYALFCGLSAECLRIFHTKQAAISCGFS